MTYEECFKTREFIAYFQKDLTKIRSARRKVWESGNGMPLRSDVYSQLENLGLFHLKKITAEFMLIIEKKSNLSANQRAFITDIIMRCVYQTLKYFEEQAKII